jgi:hypothetical protein
MTSETKTQEIKIDNAIISEIANVLVNLEANSDIISIVASWKDTLDDKDVLAYLKEWNAKNALQLQ